LSRTSKQTHEIVSKVIEKPAHPEGKRRESSKVTIFGVQGKRLSNKANFRYAVESGVSERKKKWVPRTHYSPLRPGVGGGKKKNAKANTSNKNVLGGVHSAKKKGRGGGAPPNSWREKTQNVLPTGGTKKGVFSRPAKGTGF